MIPRQEVQRNKIGITININLQEVIMEKEILEKINKFTRREFSENELYVFSVILCDNEVDRDRERFSDNALNTLKSLFVGKTGIFDHDPSSSNQTARIFDTELITDSSRTTKNGEPYKYLKASAYMVRTDENKNLIAEIDGGIKKEVSISCSAGKKTCSVCGRNKISEGCSHIRGKSYNGKLCHTVLDDISDAYEWSFVAVPAQVNAGVTKKYTEETEEKSASLTKNADIEKLCREIIRMAFFRGGTHAVQEAERSIKGKSEKELLGLKKAYERLLGHRGVEVQLVPEASDSTAEQFKL